MPDQIEIISYQNKLEYLILLKKGINKKKNTKKFLFKNIFRIRRLYV